MTSDTIEIRPCQHFEPERFVAIAGGYETKAIYQVMRTESDKETHFTLRLTQLDKSAFYGFPYDAEELERYGNLVREGYCWGAYEGSLLVAAALAEPRWWNNTMWVWEFHVAATHFRRGIGRRLMDRLALQAKEAGLRALVLETQNTNVNAIRFYRRVGFTIDGVDISYYTNEDMEPGQTVAVFMKRKLK